MNQCVQANLVNQPSSSEDVIGEHLTLIPPQGEAQAESPVKASDIDITAAAAHELNKDLDMEDKD